MPFDIVDPMIKAKEIFDDDLLKQTKWVHSDTNCSELESSLYYRLWKNYEGGHKKYSYFHLYDRLFTEYIGRKPKVLEIGVYEGASIKTWRDFFGEGATIVGIDINPECIRYEDVDQNIHVRIGSQNDKDFLSKLKEEFGEFDLILDDGSHQTSDVIESFNYLFLNCLSKNGVYFIEDLNTSYWEDYRSSKHSGIDMGLSLCELMNHFYIGNKYKNYFRESYPEHFVAPLIATLVSEVRFFDSATAIYKNDVLPPLVFRT